MCGRPFETANLQFPVPPAGFTESTVKNLSNPHPATVVRLILSTVGVYTLWIAAAQSGIVAALSSKKETCEQLKSELGRVGANSAGSGRAVRTAHPLGGARPLPLPQEHDEPAEQL